MEIRCGTNPCNACPIGLLPLAVREPLGDLLRATVSELSVENVRLLNRSQMEALIRAGNTSQLLESARAIHASEAACIAVGVTTLRKASRKDYSAIT